MFKANLIAGSLALALLSTIAHADSVTQTNGGDSFTAGGAVTQSYDAPRDVFAAGDVVTARGVVAGDVHVAGMDVVVDADTGADLYAAGASVAIGADVAEDLSAMGYSVRLSSDATVAGNARLMGRAVTIDGPVAGALSVAAAEVTLNATISGDAWIAADTISFGPDARILGRLTYSTEHPIRIPDQVIDPDRVSYEQWNDRPMLDEIRRNWDNVDMPMLPTFMSWMSAFIITLVFFMIIGAIGLTFAPGPVATMRRQIANRPGHVFLLGILGLSVLFGLVPITALTIVGLPFVPVAILMIILAWTLGYILGAYAVAMWAYIKFGGADKPTLLVRLVILAIAVCVVTLLNYIPFIGWIINFTLVLLGIGAMTNALFHRLVGNAGYAMDADMNPIKE